MEVQPVSVREEVFAGGVDKGQHKDHTLSA
jgi:hypothetical protein